MQGLSRQNADSSDLQCPLCAGKLHLRLREIEHAVTRGSFDVFRCGGCGLGKTVPVPADLGPYYENYHGGRHGPTARHCNNRRIALVEESMGSRRPGRLLDIGCGDGSFLLAARQRGWQVQGTEFNPREARQKGLDVVTGLDEIPGTPVFDCVTLWHSLEHLCDPVITLKKIRGLLSPTGSLLIAVPDIDGFQARLFGRRWFHLDVPRHLYHYSKRSMQALLQATGFCPVRRWRQEFEYDLIGWPQSALNCVLPTPNVFIDVLMGRSPRCSAAEKIASLIAGTVLTGLAVPLVAMATLVNRGSTLIVAARPCDLKN